MQNQIQNIQKTAAIIQTTKPPKPASCNAKQNPQESPHKQIKKSQVDQNYKTEKKPRKLSCATSLKMRAESV